MLGFSHVYKYSFLVQRGLLVLYNFILFRCAPVPRFYICLPCIAWGVWGCMERGHLEHDNHAIAVSSQLIYVVWQFVSHIFHTSFTVIVQRYCSQLWLLFYFHSVCHVMLKYVWHIFSHVFQTLRHTISTVVCTVCPHPCSHIVSSLFPTGVIVVPHFFHTCSHAFPHIVSHIFQVAFTVCSQCVHMLFTVVSKRFQTFVCRSSTVCSQLFHSLLSACSHLFRCVVHSMSFIVYTFHYLFWDVTTIDILSCMLHDNHLCLILMKHGTQHVDSCNPITKHQHFWPGII